MIQERADAKAPGSPSDGEGNNGCARASRSWRAARDEYQLWTELNRRLDEVERAITATAALRR